MHYLLDLLSLLPLLPVILAAPNPTPAPQSPATQSPASSLSAASALSTASAAAAAAYYSAFAFPSTSAVDECGPFLADTSVQDSCETPVLLSNTPSAYGVQCLNDTLPPTTHPINITACVDPIRTICSSEWQYPGQWVWASAPGCTVGSFLPAFNNSAEWPSDFNCEELIYVSMLNECETIDQLYNVAAVNLEQLPDNTAGTYGAGKQVNIGYGSYIVSERQLRNLSDAQGCTETFATAAPIITECAAVGKAANNLKLVTTADEP